MFSNIGEKTKTNHGFAPPVKHKTAVRQTSVLSADLTDKQKGNVKKVQTAKRQW